MEGSSSELERKVTRLARELDEARAQQAATSEVLRVISSSPGDLEPVFRTILANATRICEASFGNLTIREGDALRHVAAHGATSEWDEHMRRNPLIHPGPNTALGRVMSTKKAVHIHDILADQAYIERDPLRLATVSLLGARTVVAVPMLKDEDLIGTIAIHRQEVHPFTEKQIALLASFASQAVIAIENVRLLNELRARTHELEARTGELTESLEQQTATGDVLNVISRSTFKLQPILDTIVVTASRLCQAEYTLVFRLQDGAYRPAAANNAEADFIRHAVEHPIPPGRGSLVGRTALERKTVHILDCLADPEYTYVDYQSVGKYRTMLGVPLLRDGVPIGVIGLMRNTVRPFTDKQIDLVTTFADQAVIAIENARLFEEVQARNREAEARSRELSESLEQQIAASEILRVISKSPTDVQPVFDTIAESAARLCKALTLVYRFDGQFLHFVAHHGLPPHAVEANRRAFPMLPGRGSAAARSMISGRIEHIPDIQADLDFAYPDIAAAMDFRSVVAVPMLRDGLPVGAIVLARAQAGLFLDRQIELVSTFADQAVIAIENVRLFEEVQTRNRELSNALEQQVATGTILQAIAASPTDIQPVLNTVAESAARLCGARDANIMLRRGDVLSVVAHHGAIPIDYTKLPIVREMVAGSVVLDRKPIHVHDMAAEGEFPLSRTIARRLGARTLLAVPLLREGEAIGVLVIRRDEVRPFSDQQIELIKTFADQAVIAIENVRLFEEVQARTAELSEALQQQTATADALKVISRSAFNLQPVLQTLVDSAIRLCGADKGSITLRDGEELRFMAGAGQSPELRAYEEANPHKLGRGSFQGRAAIEGTTIHVPDVLADPEYERKETATFGIRAVLAVPLKRGVEVIGVFGLARSTVGPFAPRQIELVESFADQAVIAIENARLFEEVQARTAELAEALQQQTATADVLKVISRSAFNIQAVLDTLAESAARLCEADIVDFYRLVDSDFQWAATFGPDADSDHTTIIRRPGRGSVSGRVLLERKTVHVPDFEADAEFTFVDVARRRGIRAILGVPLLRGDALIGLLLVMRKLPGAFSTKQIELAETFADQAVIAIENARLFEEVQARNRELTESLERQTAMSDILRVISRSPTDVQPVFETIAESAARLCSARYCVVFRFDGELIHFAAQHGLTPEATDVQRRAFPMPPGRGSGASRAILNAAVEQIPDVNIDPDYQIGETARAVSARSVLAVPMLRDGRPVGSINLGRPEPGDFPSRQIELLQTFADQAVIAIENVRLFEEVQARTAELTEALQQQIATADVLKVISRSAFDLQIVLDTLVESAVRLCHADKGGILRPFDGVFRYVALYGYSPGFLQYMEANPPVAGRGSAVGRVAEERKAVHILDALADPDYAMKNTAQAGDFRTVLAIPLLREGDLIGVFAMTRAEARSFTERDIDLVQTFADQAVIAIENVRLFEEVQAKTRDLEETLTFQKATSSVLEVIGRSASDLQPVLDVILDTAADLCHADMSVLRLMREGTLQHVASSRRNDPAVVQHARENPILPADRSSVAGRVALAGHTIHIPDVAQDAEYTFLRTLDTPIGSVLGVPLVQDGKVAGVIALLRRLAQPFTQRQIELVETFADQAVIAIENVRLFEEVQARTTELTEALEQQTATSEVLRVIASSPTTLKPVLQAVAESAARLCDAYDALLLLREGQSLVLGAHYGPIPFDYVNWPLERDWVAGRSVIDRETIQVADLAAAGDEFAAGREMSIRLGHRTVAASPLMREGEAIGTIVLRRTEVRPFTTKQIDLLKTFADQAVIAIENVRLFDEVQAKTRDLEEALTFQRASGDVLEVIGRSASTLEPVLQAIVDTAADLCQADMSVVRLLRDGALHNAAWSKRNDPAIVSYAEDHPVRPTDRSSVAGRVALEKRTIHIADIAADPEYSYLSSVVGTGVHSILGVPLFQDSEVIGVIALLRKAVNPFTERQIDLVQTFADQAVIAIENARLFKEVQQRTDDLSRSLEELRTAQDRLVQTEKLASLGQLTAGIAHEIKNPLNFVNNFSALSVELIDELREVLEKPSPGDEGRAQITELTATLAGNLEKVVQHGKRADSIVKNMLLHSRQGSGERRPANINALVEESLNLAYHGARAEKQGFTITLEKSLDPTTGDVDIFPQEITRVLLNLISNGFYATTKRGQATDGNPYEPTLLAATRNLGDRVEIRIRDNGSGIARDVRERMFDPFFTTKPAGEGTGLGLSLSHDIIVKQHSGSIEVDTELGEFTEFRIVLPRSATKHGQSGGQA